MTRQTVDYIGLVRSSASWAKVARETLLAMLRCGVDVRVWELEEDRFDPDFRLPPALAERTAPLSSRPRSERGPTFAFVSPIILAGLPANRLDLAIFVYEADRWPARWIDLAKTYAPRVVVPSRFARRGIIASGFPPNRVSVVEHGVDGKVFCRRGLPEAGTSQEFRMLFVGTPAYRKGLDLLLGALPLAFSTSDPVSLTIKMVHYPDAEARPYLDRSWRTRVTDLQLRGYVIEVIEEVVTDEGMAHLYAESDLLCQPFRGEGFCMPLLEALACETPVLVTRAAWAAERLNDDVALFVPVARTVPAIGAIADGGLTPAVARLQEVDVETLASALAAAAAANTLAQRGRLGRRLAATFTWERSASAVLRLLESDVDLSVA